MNQTNQWWNTPMTPLDFIYRAMDMRETQKDVFDTLWFDQDRTRTIHIAKRRMGKTTLSARTIIVLGFCAAGWIPPASKKQEELIALHRRDGDKRPEIADPFRIGFFTGSAKAIDNHLLDTFELFIATLPPKMQEAISYHRGTQTFTIKGKDDPSHTVKIVLKGIKRLIEDLRGGGYDVILLDEIQFFAIDKIQEVIFPMVSQTGGLGWVHLLGTANINYSAREVWAYIEDHPYGKCFKTTAKDCLKKDYDYDEKKWAFDVADAGGEDTPSFQAEFMCNFDIPSKYSLLGHWEPEIIEERPSDRYILSVDRGVRPYSIQRFWLDDDEHLVYDRNFDFWGEEVVYEKMRDQLVDENCVCLILPHDAREITVGHGLSHFAEWREALNDAGLQKVQMLQLEKHARVSDRIIETNEAAANVNALQHKENKYVNRLRQASFKKVSVAHYDREKINPGLFSHWYDAFSYGVIGYYNYFNAYLKKKKKKEFEEKEINDMKAIITGDKSYTADYQRGQYLEDAPIDFVSMPGDDGTDFGMYDTYDDEGISF